MNAALIGITTERNTASKSSALNKTTTPTNSGSLPATTCEKSSFDAVNPPTSIVELVWRSSGGNPSSPHPRTEAVVPASCGPVRGEAETAASRPFGDKAAGATKVQTP